MNVREGLSSNFFTERGCVVKNRVECLSVIDFFLVNIKTVREKDSQNLAKYLQG